MLQQTILEHYLEIKGVVLLKVFKIPYDTNREEKIFGGYLKDSVTKMGCDMVGKEFVEGSKVGEGYCQGDENRLLGD